MAENNTVAKQRRFAMMGDNLFRIASKLINNQRLCRMLKYSVEDPFAIDLPDIDGLDLLHKQILILPKIPDDDKFETSFVTVVFDQFVVNPNNPEFKICTIRFDVVCPFKTWIVNEQSLRPYLMMQEIDVMFNEAPLAGIGNLKFLKSEPLVLSPQLAGYSLYYEINDFN